MGVHRRQFQIGDPLVSQVGGIDGEVNDPFQLFVGSGVSKHQSFSKWLPVINLESGHWHRLPPSAPHISSSFIFRGYYRARLGTDRMIPTAINPGKLHRSGLLQCQSSGFLRLSKITTESAEAPELLFFSEFSVTSVVKMGVAYDNENRPQRNPSHRRK